MNILMLDNNMELSSIITIAVKYDEDRVNILAVIAC